MIHLLKNWTRWDIEFIIREFQKKDWKSNTREAFVFVLKRFVSFCKQEIIISKKNDGLEIENKIKKEENISTAEQQFESQFE